VGLNVVQLILGVLTVISAITVVSVRNPVVSALMLMTTLFLTGALYFGLGFYFIGAVQILIYAGAISVLFVFIVMLLDLKPFFLKIPGGLSKEILAGLAGLLMLSALMLSVWSHLNLSNINVAQSSEALDFATPKAISLHFLSKYMLPFQLTGLLILASVMGVTILGRPKKKVSA